MQLFVANVLIKCNEVDLEIDLTLLRDEIEHFTDDKSEDYKEGFNDCAMKMGEWVQLLIQKYFGGDK